MIKKQVTIILTIMALTGCNSQNDIVEKYNAKTKEELIDRIVKETEIVEIEKYMILENAENKLVKKDINENKILAILEILNEKLENNKSYEELKKLIVKNIKDEITLQEIDNILKNKYQETKIKELDNSLEIGILKTLKHININNEEYIKRIMTGTN